MHLMFDEHLSNTTTVQTHQPDSANTLLHDLTIKTISNAERIAQNHLQISNNEKQKLLHNTNKFAKPPTVEHVINAIEHRQENMHRRAQYNLQQTLKTIFSTNNNNNTDIS